MDFLKDIAAAESKLAIANFIGDKKMRGEAIQAIHKAKLEMRNYVRRQQKLPG